MIVVTLDDHLEGIVNLPRKYSRGITFTRDDVNYVAAAKLFSECVYKHLDYKQITSTCRPRIPRRSFRTPKSKMTTGRSFS